MASVSSQSRLSSMVTPQDGARSENDSPWPRGTGNSPIIGIPAKHGWQQNAVAGPSSEGAIASRRTSATNFPPMPHSPSSAPPVPSVISVTHPPEYIHTHHPRRGSMTPLGLHVISPLAPTAGASPVRTVGFGPPSQPDMLPPSFPRRGSGASTSSTLTQSRPVPLGQYPPGFNREQRRSSLTPSAPSLAPPSPSKTYVSGRVNSRPKSSNGSDPPRTRTGTAEARPSGQLGISPLSAAQPEAPFARRGSLPQINYGGWSGPPQRTWNPTLPPQRGSVGEDGAVQEGFKFGGGVARPTPAEAALRAVETSGNLRRLSYVFASKKEETDVFAQTEDAEAERQRRAFLAATFGDDGARARERLSLSGAASHPTTPSGNLRRQSLLLWERINGAQPVPSMETRNSDLSLNSAPSVLLSNTAPNNESLGARRPSFPIAIPGGRIARSPSRHRKIDDIDAPPRIVHTSEGEPLVSDDEEDEEEEGEDEQSEGDGGKYNTLHAPKRPLPPLLPLSDPGPRLLPSTLALHRANHLLQSRNLEAEPLPHPLPRSLHPPAPVDFSEFDIDFILAGSRAQLGGDKKSKNASIDMRRVSEPSVPATPTLKFGSGGEDEDSFAKFVGAFDDEYGDRRGEWTFRLCPRPMPSAIAQHPRSSLETPPSSIMAEWESRGAGKYELLSDGSVRSLQTGAVWNVHRNTSRQYELCERKRGSSSKRDPGMSPYSAPATHERYVLASKSTHCDSGGVKLSANDPGWFGKIGRSSSNVSQGSAGRLRVSISESHKTERAARFGSTDSNATATPLASSSLPPMATLTAAMAKQRPRSTRIELQGEVLHEGGRGVISAAGKQDIRTRLAPSRSRGESGSDEKPKSKGIGGVLKRGIASLKPTSFAAAAEEKRAAREERQREKAQSQSWSPSVSYPKSYSTSAGSRSDPPSYKAYMPERAATALASSDHLSASTPRSSANQDKMPPSWSSARAEEVRRAGSTESSPKIGWDHQLEPASREGKAWSPVPDEAVAMVVPIESNDMQSAMAHLPQDFSSITPDALPRQALLVWYVPFDSDSEERPSTSASVSFSKASSDPVAATASLPPAGISPGSVPKFQKLLRRRTSKDQPPIKPRDGPKPEKEASIEPDKAANPPHPLPFRSFRVVARIVDVEDLVSEPEVLHPHIPFDHWQEHYRASARHFPQAGSTTSSNPSPVRTQACLPSTSDEADTLSSSTAPTSTIMAGRQFPTVIAVCHSRSQGVEFVLEGLDRLGFCTGESAWGPTGYEEWRGSGLSEKGRELLDLLWAGSTGVMGLVGP